jgi:hypothetical protein
MALQAGNHYGSRFLVSVFTLYIGFELQHFNALVFAIVFARDWVKRLHGQWFQLSDPTFDAIHYGGMAIYKVGIFLFNLVPLIAIYLMGKS